MYDKIYVDSSPKGRVAMEKKKFEGILICSDIDGTVFYHEPVLDRRYVPENSCRAIKYFQDNGGRFTFATGRFPQFSAKELLQYVIPNAVDKVKAAAHRGTKMTCREGALEEIIGDFEREFVK